MTVLERSELESSSLADLHAIADQLGLEGFRRLRKADLIDAILGEKSPESDQAEAVGGAGEQEEEEEEEATAAEAREPRGSRLRRRRLRRGSAAAADEREKAEEDEAEEERPARLGAARERGEAGDAQPRTASGVVEVLGNGSAFLRVSPPEPSDEDVYISAAQVRRCELVSGDEVSGPVRTPRRSERYPSLVRIDTINGAPADSVSDGSRYEDLPVAWPSERLEFGTGDPTLEAIEWLTPLGLGSRAVIVGGRQAGKSEMLRRLLAAMRSREELELTLVLVGARPEEIAEWGEDATAPAAALSFAASADVQGQAVERAIDSAKRIASRGGNAIVLIDSLDGLHVQAARRALAAARNLREGGSLTVIAVASEPLGGETTVIALDRALTSTGRSPILDLLESGTLRAELLVGEDGARAIAQARASAYEATI